MKIKDIPIYVLAAIIVAGFFALMYSLAVSSIPEENREVLHLVVGALIGAFTTVVGFFFGSYKSSSDKNELLHNKKPE